MTQAEIKRGGPYHYYPIYYVKGTKGVGLESQAAVTRAQATLTLTLSNLTPTLVPTRLTLTLTLTLALLVLPIPTLVPSGLKGEF